MHQYPGTLQALIAETMQYAVGGTGVGLPSLLNHRLFPVEINMAEEQSRDLYYCTNCVLTVEQYHNYSTGQK